MHGFKKIDPAILLSLLILCIFYASHLFSCTGIYLKTLDNTLIYARTLEFGDDLRSEILFIPRNYNFLALAPSGKREGLAWQSKYAAVGANAYDQKVLVDGVNETGLAGGLFYFPGFAEYEEVAPADYQQSLPMWELLTFLLTTCTSVEEVREALPKIHISKALLPGDSEIIPVHLIVHDLQGNSLVIEYLKGKLNLRDNPLGVITNSPDFDWHMTNLRNYINLSPFNVAPQKVGSLTFSQLGQGSGMLGLPGDFTPPSRFVRAVHFTQTAPKAPTNLEGIYQAFHILNNFDIPKGAIIKNGAYDYTIWTSAIDMNNKIFYFRSYENFQLKKIDLMKLDLDAHDISFFPMKHTEEVLSINPKAL